MEQTLAIIKPDAVKNNQIGNICALFEKEGLQIVAMRMEHLSLEKAEKFYDVHIGKPFFEELTTFMSSGPIVVLVLEGDNAIERNRKVLGNTDPAKAEKGTVRAEYGTNIGNNAAHGSDAKDTAIREIAFFFAKEHICPR